MIEGAIHVAERPGPGVEALPLSESSQIGVATGIALAGRPVVVDLVDAAGIRRALDALEDLGTVAARSSGSFQATVVVRAPLGAEVPSVPPGVRLGIAAGGLDGMTAAALTAGGPSLLLHTDGPGGAEAGVPRQLRAGAEACVLANGRGVATALAAAESLGGREVAVVDLAGVRVTGAAAESVRCGRVVLVGTSLEGAVAELVGAVFWRLEAPPRVLGAAATPEDVVRAINEALED